MTDKKENEQPLPAKITVNEKWCKRCGICVAFCPKGVFVADEFGLPLVKHPELCVKCMLCVVRCPDFAITVEPKDKGTTPEPKDKGTTSETKDKGTAPETK